ncbi:MAG: hypothetical protein E7649_02485 [Ruminococcaceae bacterium]|nr:hypothetical protein [Oscillospiraceae bacterium]
MNTKTIFKKPRVIITAIVLAALIAIAAVVIILATDTATFKGVQVTTDGKINMLFWYEITPENAENVKTADVVVMDGYSEERTETVDLVYDETRGMYYARVRLAAAEMGYDVKVTPKTSGGLNACDTKTFSVRSYAELLLNSGSATERDARAIKAVLNYGQYANEYFKSQGMSFINTVVVNDGIYKRDTNPIIGMDSKLSANNKPTATVVDEFASLISDPKIEIVLEDSVELRLSYVWNGTTESHSGKQGEDGRWYVGGNYISTTGFATDHSADLVVNVNGVKAIDVSGASVLNCLSALKADADTYELALAMYNYYYWTNANVGPAVSQATCKHFMHYEPVEYGSEYSQPVCTFCGFKVNSVVHDEINYYSAPGQFNNYWATSGTTSSLNKDYFIQSYETDEDGTTYSRIYTWQSGQFEFTNGTATQATIGNSQTHSKTPDYKLNGGMGNYIVIKMRAGAANVGTLGSNGEWTYKDLHNIFNLGFTAPGATANSLTSRNGENYSDIYANQKVFNGWTIYVIDVAQMGNAAFAGKDLASIDMIDATMAFSGVNSVPTNGAVAGDVNGPDYRPGYTDIAYFAICDDMKEVYSIVGDETFLRTNWKNGSYDAYLTTDGDNTTCPDGVHFYDAPTKTCIECGATTTATLTENKVFTEEINLYTAPGTVKVNHAWSGSSQGVSYDEATGTLFQRININNGGATIPLTSAGHIDGTAHVTLNGGSGRFLILKMRTNAKQGLSLRLGTADAGGTLPNPGSYVARRENSILEKNAWTIYVIDLAKLSINTYKSQDTSVTKAVYGFMYGDGAGGVRFGEYVDIAYFAVVDTCAEIIDVIGKDTSYLYTNWDTVNHDKNKTAVDCVLNNHAISISGNTVNYKCEACGDVVHSVTTPTLGTAEGQVNFYAAPGLATPKWVASSYTQSAFVKSNGYTILMNDGDGFYARYGFGHTGASMYLKADTTTSSPYSNTVAKSGRYAVLRLRSPMVKRISLGVVNGSNAANDAVADTMYRQADFSEWTTYVIDLSQAGGKNYYTVGSNTSATMWLQTNNSASGYENAYITDPEKPWYLDVAYFAICDDWTAIESVVGEGEEVLFTTWNSLSNDMVRNSDGTCIEHRMVLTKDGNTYTYKCSNEVCGLTDSRTVSADVNYYSAPGQYHNFWGTYYKPMTGNNSEGQGYGAGYGVTGVNDYDAIEKQTFTRVYLNVGSQFEFTNGTSVPSSQSTLPEDTINGGMGRYIVLKARLHNVNQMSIGLGTGTLKAESNMKTRVNIATDVWITYVIDISKYNAAPFKVDETVQKVAASIQTKGGNTAGAYVDVAYFAICSDWDEIINVVGETEEVNYFTDFASGTPTTIVGGECTGDHTYVTVSTATEYSIECDICGTVKETHVIDDSINYYSAPGQAIQHYNSTPSLVIDDVDAGFAYTRINFSKSGSVRLHNQSSTNTMAVADDPIKGAGRYAVMKVRLGGTSLGQLKIGLYDGADTMPLYTTTVKTDGVVTGYTFGGPHTDILFDGASHVRGLTVQPIGEWVIYVVDLSTMTYTDTYFDSANPPTQNGDGTWNLNQRSYTFYDYTNDDLTNISVGLKIQNGAGAKETDYVDLAYFAIVDDWTEVSKVVGTDNTQIMYAANWSNADNDEYRNADGSCAEHRLSAPVITTNGNGDTVYTYTCRNANCGETYEVVSPAGVNYFSAPGQIVNNWGTANMPSLGGSCSVSNSLEGKKNALSYISAEEDMVYTQVNVYQGASFFMANGSVAAGTHTETTVDDSIDGMGKYIVLKMRNINNIKVGMGFETDTGKKIAWNSGEFRMNTADILSEEFVTYVIDVSGYVDPSATKIRFIIRSNEMEAVADARVDVAYLAIVDSWEEVKAVVGGGEEIIYTTNFNDETTGYKTTVMDASINYYSAPGQVITHYNTTNTLVSDGENGYTHIYFKESGSLRLHNNFNTTKMHIADDTISGGPGKMIVMKMYIGSKNLGRLKLGLYDGASELDWYSAPTETSAGNPNTDRFFDIASHVRTITDDMVGKWITVVVELDSLTRTSNNKLWYDLSNADMSTMSVGLKVANGIKGGEGRTGVLEDDYINLAYFAIVDNWTEVQTVVGTDTDVTYASKWSDSTVDVTKTAADIQALVDAEAAQ